MSEQINEQFLDVRNLTVQYVTDGEVVHAVNNISFTQAGCTAFRNSHIRLIQTTSPVFSL